MEIARYYGPIARLWIGPVLIAVLANPVCFESVVKYDKLCSRGYLLKKTKKQVFRNGLLCTDGDKWRRYRKIVSSILHVNILEWLVENLAKTAIIYRIS
jgi:cytochrome P450